jgi:hypothetical protein
MLVVINVLLKMIRIVHRVSIILGHVYYFMKQFNFGAILVIGSASGGFFPKPKRRRHVGGNIFYCSSLMPQVVADNA